MDSVISTTSLICYLGLLVCMLGAGRKEATAPQIIEQERELVHNGLGY